MLHLNQLEYGTTRQNEKQKDDRYFKEIWEEENVSGKSVNH